MCGEDTIYGIYHNRSIYDMDVDQLDLGLEGPCRISLHRTFAC